MAKLYPRFPEEGTPHSERQVWAAAEHLDDRWRVFHSVAWQSERAGRQGDGEADFVFLHPERGVVVVEVKGGSIELVDGVWFSRNRTGRHEIKNPFDQVVASKHALVRYLRDALPSTRVPVCHAVVFPNGSVVSDIGTYGPRQIVIDGADLVDLGTAIARVTEHWGVTAALSKDDMGAITRLLAPTTTVVTRLRTQVAEAEAQLLELTNQQIAALQMLRHLRRAVLRGSAGTGKTVLAVERARRLTSDGFDTALICFNSPLGARLRAETGGAVTFAGTFHSFCSTVLRAAGRTVPEPGSEWWDNEVAYALLDAVASTGSPVGAIVIDEAQDFRTPWLEGLLAMLDEHVDAPFYVFADSAQALYVEDWDLPGQWPELVLDVNCRNTLPIAAKVAALFGAPVSSLGTSGPDPVFLVAPDDELVHTTTTVIHRLLEEEDLRPSQIVVLSDQRAILDRLRQLAVGDWLFVEPGRQGIATETIHRFKGLESEVAVVLLTNPSDLHDLRRIAYVGLSRARSMLFVVATKQIKRAISW